MPQRPVLIERTSAVRLVAFTRTYRLPVSLPLPTATLSLLSLLSLLSRLSLGRSVSRRAAPRRAAYESSESFVSRDYLRISISSRPRLPLGLVFSPRGDKAISRKDAGRCLAVISISRCNAVCAAFRGGGEAVNGDALSGNLTNIVIVGR